VRFSEAARAAAVEHARRSVEEGGSLVSAARELGVEYQSLRRWSAMAPSAFRRVRVEHQHELPAKRVVVTLPSGASVEGLDVAGIAELLRRLA